MIPQYSCLPDQLYRTGGFYDDTDTLEELRGLADKAGFITDMGELWPGFKSRRDINGSALLGRPDFVDKLIAHYEWVNDIFTDGAASRVTRLRDVYLFGNVIYRIVDGQVARIYETARAIDRPYNPEPRWTANEFRTSALHIATAHIPLYLGSAGSSNYRHWLIDDLPRAAAIQQILNATDQSDVEYLIPGFDAKLNQLKTDSLTILGQCARNSVVRFIPHDALLHLDALYYATPVSYHPALKSPQAVNLLRDRGRAYPFASPTSGKLLYLQGSEATSPLANHDQVARIFRSFGFTVLNVNSLTFGQRLAAIRSARLVAGPIGDALTDVLFCEPGATLLQLAPEGDTESFYWDLAHAADHKFAGLYGKPAPTQQGAAVSQYQINLGQLSSILTRLLQL